MWKGEVGVGVAWACVVQGCGGVRYSGAVWGVRWLSVGAWWCEVVYCGGRVRGDGVQG